MKPGTTSKETDPRSDNSDQTCKIISSTLFQ